jgi:hypothetical protein
MVDKDPPKKARLSSLTYVCFMVNTTIEKNRDHGVTFDDVYNGIENGTLWKDIEAKVPGFDLLRILTGEGPQGAAVLATLEHIADWLRGKEANKCGVEADGLALLSAFCLEAIGDRLWTTPEPAEAPRRGPPAR